MASVVKHPGLVRVRPNRSAWAMNAARQFNCSPGAGDYRRQTVPLSLLSATDQIVEDSYLVPELLRCRRQLHEDTKHIGDQEP